MDSACDLSAAARTRPPSVITPLCKHGHRWHYISQGDIRRRSHGYVLDHAGSDIVHPEPGTLVLIGGGLLGLGIARRGKLFKA